MALKALDFEGAQAYVDDLRDHLEFPKIKPWDLRIGAWIVDGMRISMFIACERGDRGAVARYVEEIDYELEELPSDQDVEQALGQAFLLGAARSWAKGWQAELQGDWKLALRYRSGQCRYSEHNGRIKALLAEGTARYGARTEVALIVDCYTDWIRTVRVMRPPLGNWKPQRAAAVAAWEHHEVLALVNHQLNNRWSYRRACARLGYESADRGEYEDALDFLTLAKGALGDRDHEKERLITLEQPLIEAEIEFATYGTGHDPEKVERHRTAVNDALAENLMSRRMVFLNSWWPFFLATHAAHTPPNASA